MDFSRVSFGEMVAGVSGLVFLVVMFFFDWFAVDVSEASDAFGSSIPGLNGWDSYGFPFDLLLFLAAVAAVAQVALRAADAMPPGLPVSPAAIVAAGGAFAVFLVFVRLVSTPDIQVGGVQIAETSRKAGVFLALLAAGGIAFGGYTAIEERAARPRRTARPRA